jgi:RNA polymerase sigma factor (sigma-70 family)
MSSEQQQTPGAEDARPGHRYDVSSDKCQLAARQLLVRYNWTFISEEQLGAQIAHQVADTSETKPLPVLAHMCAAAFLHNACKAIYDPQALEQGYTALFHYLQRIAVRRWPDQALDIVQAALELTYKQLDRCQSPESFLAFARFKLLQAAREELGVRSPPLSLEEEAVIQQQASPVDVAAEVINLAEAEELIQAIQRLTDHRQRVAVFRKHFRRESDQAIARELGITTKHLAVLRLRAMQQLRKDRRLRAIFLQEDSD